MGAFDVIAADAESLAVFRSTGVGDVTSAGAGRLGHNRRAHAERADGDRHHACIMRALRRRDERHPCGQRDSERNVVGRQRPGYWTVTEMRMSDASQRTRTELTFEKVEYNVGLTPDDFSRRELERGRQASPERLRDQLIPQKLMT